MNKINVYAIVHDHIKTLRNNRTQKVSWLDLGFFFGLPFIIAGVLIYFDKALDADARNIFGITLAVLIGFLFNVLLLVHNLIRSFEGQARGRREYLQEVYFNVAFANFVALFALVLLMSTVFLKTDVAIWVSGSVYYFAAVFIFTLLMVLKRLHFLFSDQFTP